MSPYRPRRPAVSACILLVSLAFSPAAKAEARPDLDGSVRLSNERTITRWANAEHRALIRKRPISSSRRITRVHSFTEDGFPEVYLLLRRWTDPEGGSWLQVRIPMRPNGRKGWVRDSALGRSHLVRTRLEVDRKKQRATLFRSGQRIWRSRVGVGAPLTPTPAGRFWIRERIKVAESGSSYGPWAFGTSAYSRLSEWPGGGVIGIHGTDQPNLIPGRPSHGCVRVRNGAIKRLAHRMPTGTPVRIR
ncbi:MAG: L,D-transpeptidase [Solirubrobacterales bacterium]